MLPLTVFLVFVLGTSIFISYWYNKISASAGGHKMLPGLTNFPLFGCAIQIAYLNRKYKNFQLFEKLCQQYGPVIGLQIGFQYTVVVEDFETAKQILSSEDWQARNPDYSPYRAITFDKQVGIMFAYGEGWRENRKFVLKTLKTLGLNLRDKLDLDLMDEMQYFFQHFDKQRELANDDVDMHGAFKLAALNVLWRTLCATRLDNDDEFAHFMIKRVETTVRNVGIGCNLDFAFPFLTKIPGLTFQQYQVEGITMLHDYFKEIVDERRKIGSYATNPQDFVEYYLQKIDETAKDGVQDVVFNDEQLIQSCCDMFLAGSDSTGSSLEFAILYMAKFPEVQRKAQAEIDRVIPKGQLPRYSDADWMPYMQAVILESMRHATVTPIIPRTSITETKLNDCHIPKNTMALINFYKINHDKTVFGDPEAFRPERFLDSNGNLLKDCTTQFLHFGLGRRICVGMPLAKATLFTIVASFLQRYTLEPSLMHPKLSVDVDSFSTGVSNQPAPWHSLVKLRKPATN